MNADNYASLEASQALVKAGIVIERDTSRFCLWYHGDELYMHVNHEWLYRVRDMFRVYEPNINISLPGAIPCYTWAEMWRELPYHMDGYGSLWLLTGIVPALFTVDTARD